MGSFVNGLAKGFIRSAVNQVGRDAGKVVSNDLYGDRHSTPYRNVSGNKRVVDVGEIKEEGMQVIEPSVTVAVIWSFVGLFFNFLGAIMLLAVGFYKMRNKHISHAWVYESQAVYVSDRRRKIGMRYDSDNLTRRKVSVMATEEDMERNEKIAKIYLWAGFIILLLCITITMASNGIS